MVRGALLAVLMVAGVSLAAHAQQPQKDTSKTMGQPIEDPINRNPMVIFIAEGPPNSCGPGCNRWIAADGDFDRGSSERVIKFLDDYKNLRLPIYFHSTGGLTDQAIDIGRHLRQLRMQAGIGRTALQHCAGSATSQDCRRLIEITRDRSAQLRVNEGLCASACVYAFIGASSRDVGLQARVGVHAAVWAQRSSKGFTIVTSAKLSLQETLRRERHELKLWQYVGQMGSDPSLVDFAAKVDPRGIRYLNGDELVRFGIVTTDRFETPWIGRDEAPNTGYTLFKKHSRQDHGVFLTTTVGISCYRRDRATVYIEREIPRGEAENVPIIRLFADGKAAWVSNEGMSANPSVDFRAQTIPFDDVFKLFPKQSFELALDYRAPEWAKRSTTIKLSIAGLETNLAKMRRRCEEFH